MAAKEALDIPGVTTTGLPYTVYYSTIRRARNPERQREYVNSSKLYYMKPSIEEWENAHNSCRQYEGKLSMICIGHNSLTHGYLVTRNDQ